MNIEILEQEQARRTELLTAMARDVFDDLDPGYIGARVPHMVDPMLVMASDELGPLGFKLGYRDSANFYSWLGGVHPRARRQGLATELMRAQHAHVHSMGYRNITTRTRASNRTMIILNRKCGFEIVGFEINDAGFAVVNQRKGLDVEANAGKQMS
ncbi:MAG: GNAT family N-acetyltransferase [Wenzhouxiangellaceae bacterium]